MTNKVATSTEQSSQAIHALEHEGATPDVRAKQEQDEQASKKQIPPVATAEPSTGPNDASTPNNAEPAGTGGDDATGAESISKITSATDSNLPTIRGPDAEPPFVVPGHADAPAPEDEATSEATVEDFPANPNDTTVSGTAEHAAPEAELFGEAASTAEPVSRADPVSTNGDPAPSVHVTEDRTTPTPAESLAEEPSKRFNLTPIQDIVDEDHNAEELIEAEGPATSRVPQTAPFQELGESVPAVHKSEGEESPILEADVTEAQIPLVAKAEDSFDEFHAPAGSATINRKDPDAPDAISAGYNASATEPVIHAESAPENGGPSAPVHIKEEHEGQIPEQELAPVAVETSADEPHDSGATPPVGGSSLLVVSKPDTPKEPLAEVGTT